MYAVPGKHVAFLLLGGLAIQVLGGFWLHVMVRFLGVEMGSGGLFILLVLLPPMLALLTWSYLYMGRFEIFGDRWFGLGRLDRWSIGAALATALVGVALSVLLTSLLEAPLGRPKNPLVDLLGAGAQMDTLFVAGFVIFGVVVASLWEELLFRGALYGWLRTRLPILASAASAGAAHALIHFDLAALPALLVLFTLFAIAYEHFDNLWVPILAHATNNLVAVLAVLAGLGV